jgi:hypothetical protein
VEQYGIVCVAATHGQRLTQEEVARGVAQLSFAQLSFAQLFFQMRSV